MDMNRSDGDGCCHDEKQECSVRGRWLVRMSVLFAVCLEVIPIEMQVMDGVSSIGSLALILLVKAVCLTLIFLPLLVFVFVNGVSALKHVRGGVIAVVAIVAVNLAIDFLLVSAAIRAIRPGR